MAKKDKKLFTIDELIASENIAQLIKGTKDGETVLTRIGLDVSENFTFNSDSMKDWDNLIEKGLELIKPALGGKKEFPFPGASNYKDNGMLKASYEFGERAYTELLRPKDLVKVETIAQQEDDQRIGRVSDFMNYQINHDIHKWREDERDLFYRLPLMGSIFKRIWFDADEDRYITDTINYPNFKLNNKADSFDTSNFSVVFKLTRNEVEERVRSEDFLSIEFNEDEEEKTITFIDQYIRLDLDGDGYKEPYIVTIEKDRNVVVRVVRDYNEKTVIEEDEEILRIERISDVSEYRFMPSSDGSYLGLGYFHYLSAITQAINTAVNQITDAATYANVQSMLLAKGVKLTGGQKTVEPGAMIQTNIRPEDLPNAIIPLQFKEPSAVLSQLMEFLKNEAKATTASADLSGAIAPQAAATTTLALVAEEQLSTTALLHSVARSMGDEFKLLYKLNLENISSAKYNRVLGNVGEPTQYKPIEDFGDDLDITPTANPENSSKLQRIQMSQFLVESYPSLKEEGANGVVIWREILSSLGFDNVDELLPQPDPDHANNLIKTQQDNAELQQKRIDAEFKYYDAQAQLVTMQAQKEQAQIEKIQLDISLAPERLRLDILKAEANAMKNTADATLSLEKAETEEVTNKLTLYTESINDRTTDKTSGERTATDQT